MKLDSTNDTVGAVQSGAWSVSIVGAAQISGSVLIQGGSNSIITAPKPASVSGVGTFNINPIGNGSVFAVPIGLIPVTSVVNTIPSSMMVGASVFGTVPVTQVTSPWVINVPSPSTIAYQLAGSIMAVSATVNTGNSSVQLLGSQAVIGSVAVLQGTDPWKVNVPTPSYISYQLAGSVMAVAATVNTGNSSVQLLGGVAVIGSIATLQGTNPWLVNDVGSVLVALKSTAASVITVIQSGNSSITGTMSVIGTVPVTQASGWTTSLVSTVPSSVMVSASIFGTVPVTQTTSPWVINMPSPSVIAYQLAGSVMAVNTTVTTGPSSVQLLSTSASIATLINNQLTGVSSVQLMAGTNNAGSITAIQGTNPWVISNPSVTAFQGGTWATSVVGALNISGSVLIQGGSNSIITAPQPASVLAFQGTLPWVMQSIVGTYQEDSPHTSTDRGLFMLHVRNDTLSSVTSTDGDYSTNAVGPSGETVVANSPITKWVSGATSVMYGTSVQVLAAPGTSIFTYITGIHVMNESANISRVTITQGLGRVPASMMTWAVAPASGGSNMNFPNPLKTVDNVGISASISGISSVFVTITGFTSKT